jgi:hypothetical protein
VYLPAFESVLGNQRMEITATWPFPADGSIIAAGSVTRMLAAFAGKLIPEKFAGETVCMLIGRRKQA